MGLEKLDQLGGIRIGLIVDVHDDHDLLDAAYAKAEEVIANSPFGVAMTKEAMWTALEISGLRAAIELENRQQLLFSTTADPQESRRALSERRPPRWTNS
jgi:enoyl-CoA hydratase